MIFYVVISTILTLAPKQEKQEVSVPYSPPFGILEPIHFTHSINYPSDVSFLIDNIEGRPITTDTDAIVYTVPTSRTKFGYQQSLAFMAKAVGIDTETQKYNLQGLKATYQDELRTLDVDITTFNFEYELNYSKTPTIFSRRSTPDVDTVKEEAKSFLRKMNKFSQTLAQGTQNVIFLSYDPPTDTFNVVNTPEEANVVEVDFFAPNLNSHPVVSPTYFNSHVFVTMVFTEEGPIVIKSHVASFDPIDPSAQGTQGSSAQRTGAMGADTIPTSGTYPIKTGDDAWQELITGKGIIVSPSKGSTKIIVREMFIGYYALEEYQPYIMPVYVFLGDNGFAGYVSAVKDEYVSKILKQPISPSSYPLPTPEGEPTITPSEIVVPTETQSPQTPEPTPAENI